MDLSLLGFKKPGARGTHPSSQELRDALRDNGDRLDVVLQQFTDGIQEGVVTSDTSVLPYTRLDASTVRVFAGTAWIDGDGVSAGQGSLNGRYRVTWPQTDISVPAASGANSRLHRIVIPVPSGGHGVSAPILLAGADDAAATLNNENGAVPVGNGRLQFATILVNSTGIPNLANIRDRRRFARGYRRRFLRTTTTGNTTSNSSGATSLFGGVLDQRIEGDGVNVVEFEIAGHISVVSGNIWKLLVYEDGVAIKEWSYAGPWDSDISARFQHIVPAGSHLYTLNHVVSVSGSSAGFVIDTSDFGPRNVIVAAREIVGGQAYDSPS